MGAAKSLVIFAVLVSILATASFGRRYPGGWLPIKNPNDDPKAVEIAKFAVAKYNRDFYKALVLVSVVKGQTRQSYNPSETTYDLHIYAKDSAVATEPAGEYVTVVGDIPSKKFRELIAFHQIG